MLAEAMLQMLDCTATQRMAMGRRGRDKAEREFDERFVIDAYLEALKKIAAPDGIVFRANPTPAGNRDSV
jgi:glycosyltransferase involved in cell wall biosynthesis